ncbi:hypothetical protein N480_17730 [Pseudoalteromonas luteoviolacea S2607]|uniref:hypothetical protein n=1 Tax=Pseudoalteromonas luteoviolacea TaxID=43657 RepID=UPI0007B04616|nr:hypothetical protein [Pseudoalteromonas luteoviolacea]KZN36541.1 hypothetical protein N480_17730 [Pseudoalteromonas luteoviolacea S2607]
MNKVSDQEIVAECDSTSVIAKSSRSELIDKFDDLKTPTGDDFESLIRSGFNQIDDPIAVTQDGDEQEISVTSTLSVSPDGETEQFRVDDSAVTVDHKLHVSPDGGELKALKVEADTLTMYDKVKVDSDANDLLQVSGNVKSTGELKSQSANVSERLTAGEISVRKGATKALEAGLDADNQPYVTTSGTLRAKESVIAEKDVQAGSLNVSGEAELGGATTAHQLTVAEKTMLQGELFAAKKSIFESHVEVPKLGVGLDEQSTAAKVHIGKRSTDTSDLLRVDDLNQDATPFIINPEGRVGVGTATPDESFHVTNKVLVGKNKDEAHILLGNNGNASFAGEVEIGQSLDVAGSAVFNANVHVETGLSVGAQAPTAKLDVQSNQGDILNLGNTNDSLVKVTNAPLVGEHPVNIWANTQVSENLNVGEKVTANRAEIEMTLNAGDTHLNSLDVSENTTVLGQTRTRQLQVGEQPNVPVQSDAGAIINTTLDVRAHADFTSIHAADVIESDVQVVSPEALAKQALTVGENAISDDATLTVKGTASETPALLVKDKEGNHLVRVKRGEAVMGSSDATLSLAVKGDVTTPLLTVTEHAKVKQADFSEHVVIAKHNLQSDWTTDAKLSVLAHNEQSQSVDISYFDGLNTTSLIHAKAKNIGFFQANPQAQFHVGEAALFDKNVTSLTGVHIADENSEFGGFSAMLSQTVVGTSQKSADFSVYGNTDLHGAFSIVENEHIAVNFSASQLTLTQQAETPILKVTNTAGDAELNAAPGQLAINQMLPSNEVNLAVTGRADVTGQLNVNHNGDALTVDGRTKLMGHATLKDGLAVSVTNNTGDAQRAALQVSGESVLDGELNVTQRATLEHDLLVRGNTTISSNLEVGRSVIIEEDLNVHGEHYAAGSVEIQGTEGRDALTVNNDVSFRADLDVAGNLSLAPYQASARLHISEKDLQAIRVDDPAGNVQMVVSRGYLGLGMERPEFMLDVAEDARFRKDLAIQGRLEIDDSLHVNEYASFRSNVNVYGTSELLGETRIGVAMHASDEDEVKILRSAQLSLEQNHFEHAFAIYHKGANPIVFQDGRVGIRNDKPEAELDIVGDVKVEGDIELNGVLRGTGQLECLDGAKILGDVELRSDLTVYDDALFKDTVTIEGQTTIERKLTLESDAVFAKSLHLGGELTALGNAYFKDAVHLDKDATIRGSLIVEGLEPQSQVALKPAVNMLNTLSVQGTAKFSDMVRAQKLDVQHKVSVGDVHTEIAMLAVNTSEGENALDIGVRGNSELILDGNANLGLGCAQPQHKLDVQGDVRVTEQLKVEGELILESQLHLDQGAQIVGDCSVQGELAPTTLKMPAGPCIEATSADIELGGDAPSDHVIATQAAVKAYVDEHAWRFGRGKKVVAVHNQDEFDAVFSRENLNNMTILLFPHNGHRQVSRAYKLKNSVQVGSNLSIIGFNERETRIVKAHVGCRFIVRGDRDAPVKHVSMHGFTFDGAIHEVSREMSMYEGNGGAFNLRYADQIELNCVIENHCVSGDGGAIYGEDTTNIEAKHIRNCRAGRQGGAAYGLRYAKIEAQHCQAERGGAVAHCDESEVLAISNVAQLHGGGAYKCQNLICKGFWRRNTAQKGEGDHIYSAGCYHLEEEQEEHKGDFLWHALFLDRPMNDSRYFWRNDHV